VVGVVVTAPCASWVAAHLFGAYSAATGVPVGPVERVAQPGGMVGR
jgi:hypothetical protein